MQIAFEKAVPSSSPNPNPNSSFNSTKAMIHDLSAGFIAGFISVFLIIYAFQPNRPYPSWMLEPVDQPWMLILILIIIFLLFHWDYLIGILLTLFVLAIVFDVIVLTKAKVTETDEPMYTPAIQLLPASFMPPTELFTSKTESFENQKVRPEILPTEDQISKKWTINLQPDPQDLKRNREVNKREMKNTAAVSGKPVDDAIQADHYPLFNEIVSGISGDPFYFI